MPRLRRYRVFLIFALIVIALLYHVSKNSQWERSQAVGFGKPTRPDSAHDTPQKPVKQEPIVHQPPKPATTRPLKQADTTTTPNNEPTIKIPKLKETDEVEGAYGLPTKVKTKEAPSETTTAAGVPVSKPGTGHHENTKEDESPRYADWPRPQDGNHKPSSEEHWKKPHEFYPVPEESVIALPAGQAKSIPKVQYVFPAESAAAKEKRESRLLKIKAETKRAWTGYKQFAWKHDEVKPISKIPHDPFCGWAATLVDALDTLWIMGMKEEFDEAVEAVKEIDFTTTPYRSDIPVFETIIRYLGGLIGAYDVTGGDKGNYKALLDKAEELAEILMSVFDTPNRMPILYYQWKPSYNESPKRASANSGVAEMGSMSMEFTRLAQLTGKNRYYDAIARITNALEDLQTRPGGTAIVGIFPQNIDASGCNRTAAAERKAKAASEAARKQAEAAKDLEEEPVGWQPAPGAENDNHDRASKPFSTDSDGDGKTDLVFDVKPATSHGLQKRAGGSFTAAGEQEDPDCVPQGLTSPGYGMDSYSMGGSQDSAYEYFPKQYVLLGGLEPKYRAMHEKTVEGVKKYLLFRPEAEGDPDILFSAKAFSSDGTDQKLTYEYEVTHLTCFLGGMFGLGGKIFESNEDVEIGKRLAAGCAWAYEVMPTGIMPEYAQIMPCANATNCQFSRKKWEEKIDPSVESRRKQVEDYYVRMEEWKKEVEEIKRKKAEMEREHQEVERKKKAEDERRKAEELEEQRLRPMNSTATGQLEDAKDLKEKSVMPPPIARRDHTDDDELPKSGRTERQGVSKSETKQRQAVEDVQKPMVELHFPPEPIKPISHEDYVKSLNLVPGFTTITDRRYILRPEAIESVWYMYRITGDPVWQDRGWKMWEAVIRATQTDIGHSAIYDVTKKDKYNDKTDSMESFWLAETLKYFYLLFSEPDVISLDEWVLNTEAHPFRRPV
ncbi:hypothetical protein OQA88_9864 [Cercophora sp. LCS_1]